MHGYDSFPEPKIVIAALEACKRINDHSLAVRYLEALKVSFKFKISKNFINLKKK